MSLFKARDLWMTQCGVDEVFDHQCLTLLPVSGHSDKIIVGSHTGYLRIYQPIPEKNESGSAPLGYKPTDLLIEMQLPHPVLQVEVGKLVSGSQQHNLSVLHPRSVAVYNLHTKSGATEHGDQSRLIQIYEHNLRRSAYSMVIGSFGNVQGRDFICVQSLDGTLSFFEQETFAFNRFLPGFLLPGPLVYVPRTDSFITVSSSWQVESYRYQVLAEAGDSGNDDVMSGKKIIPDWSYNLGETALDIQAISWSVVNCDILILGKSNLFCLKDNGVLKFMKRLQYKPCCFYSYFVEPDGKLMIIIITDSNTLMVYENTTLRWTAQLEIVPIAVKKGNLRNINGCIILLSDTGQLQCCYLGTEPSLFMAPPLEVGSLDYRDAEKELKELNKIIRVLSKESTDALTSTATEHELDISVTSQIQTPVDFANRLMTDEDEQLPICTVSVQLVPHVPLNNVQTVVIVQPPLAAEQVTHSISSLCEVYQISTFVYLKDIECDVTSLEVRVVTSYMTSIGGYPRVLQNYIELPLRLVAFLCPAVKDADYKITLNINQPAIPLAELFPEYVTGTSFSNTSAAVGFCFHRRNTDVVSIFTAKTSQRYRLQCNRLCSIFIFATQLVKRLNKHYSKSKGFVCSYTSSLPVQELFTEVEAHLTYRQNIKRIQDELGLKAAQYRAVQRRLLTKFKDKTPTPLSNLDTLLAETHQSILVSASELEENQNALNMSSCQLSCMVRLILLLLFLMDTTTTQHFEDIQAALSSSVYDSEEQGWEEVTDAAVTYLLRTSLAKSDKEKHRLNRISLEPVKDTEKLKKHISSAIDRLSRYNSMSILKKKDDKDDFISLSTPKPVSPIPEGNEATDVEDDNPVPVGSQYGERIASAQTRVRSALLSRRMKMSSLVEEGAEISTLPENKSDFSSEREFTEKLKDNDDDNNNYSESTPVTLGSTESPILATKGNIESPEELFPSGYDEDDMW